MKKELAKRSNRGPANFSLRSTDASGGLGGDGGERELADGDGGAEIGGEAGGADAAAPGADGEEVEVVVAGGLGPVVGLGGLDGEPAAAGPGPGGGAEAEVEVEGPRSRSGQEREGAGERGRELPAEGLEGRRGGEGGGELRGGDGSGHSCGGWLVMAVEEYKF